MRYFNFDYVTEITTDDKGTILNFAKGHRLTHFRVKETPQQLLDRLRPR